MLSWLRDRGRDRLVLASEVIELIADESLHTESRLERQRIALESCFEKVPPAERELLVRAYRPEAKIQDVALTSGRSVGGFYQWLHRMRRLLLDCVNRELAEESLS